MSAFIALLSSGIVAFAASLSPADDPNLPDLVSDPVENPVYEVQWVDGRWARLIRFDGYVHNAGSHPMQFSGTRAASDPPGEMTSITQTGHGTARAGNTLKYESSDGHAHWHLGRAAGYSLVDGQDALVAPASKVGFCLLDSERLEGSAPQIPHERNHNCESPGTNANGRPGHGPAATSLTMTLSPGWRDIYGSDVWLQWVDVSHVQPGRYWLQSVADPDDLIVETDESNPPHDDVEVKVEGYTAQPVTASGARRHGSTTFALDGKKFDDPDMAPAVGAVEYKIVSAPGSGTINRPVGTWFSGSSVQFTPDAATRSAGSAEITYVAREVGAQFPASPASAKATVALAPQVTAATPQAWVEAGSAPIQLTSNTSGVTWSKVSGPGSVTAGGSFSSPDPGPAVLRATSPDDAQNSGTVAVEVRPHVTIASPPSTVEAGGTHAFTASEGNVTWSAARGSFSGSTYTAPATAGSDTITARASDGRTGSATLTVLGTFTVGPTPAEVQKGHKLQLTSTVPVDHWSKLSGGGSIDTSTGEYTAPDATGTATVRATAADGRTRDKTISIIAGPTPVAISPDDPTIDEGTSIDLESSVPGVTWTKTSGPGTLATVDADTARYTAPDPYGGPVVIRADTGDGRSDTVTITVRHEDVVVTPPSAVVEEGGTVDLEANLGGVTWSVEGDGGVDANGTFTAGTPGAVKVWARVGGRADHADITVTAKDLVLTAPRDWVWPTATLQLGATPADNVRWDVHSGGGSVAGNGLYTAPGIREDGVVVRGERYGKTGEVTFDVVEPPAVTISGAPAEVVAGTSVQLTASGGSSVAWETDLGSVSGSGLFTAPSQAGGTATVRVRGPYGATDAVRIKIAPKLDQIGIPGGPPEFRSPASPETNMKEVLPKGTSTGHSKRKGPAPTFDRLGAKLSGPYVTASLRPGRSGKLRISLMRGKRWLSSCNARARAHVPLTCRFKVKGSRRDLRITATFRSTGRKPMVKRMAVKGSRQTRKR